MKTPNEVKENVKENKRQIAKESKKSSCCGPTCCDYSNDKNNINKKDK